MSDLLEFDFGFTAVDENELEAVRNATDGIRDLKLENSSLDKRTQLLYNSILPLLNNLQANPEKDYIYWPNRYDKLVEFEQRLRDIMNGEIT